METVKYILGQPEYVEDIAIYPIKVKHYDEFLDVQDLVLLGYEHFSQFDKNFIAENQIRLLDLIFLYISNDLDNQVKKLEKLFSLVCRKPVKCIREQFIFIVGEENPQIIHRLNYDQIREIIMKQNLLFSPPVYKNKKIQEIANKVLMTRAKNALKSTIEDMISTVEAAGYKTYDQIAEYTIYQLKASFQRILKIESYRTMILFKTVDTSGKIKPEHYAEEIDMLKNPYNDIFKEKQDFTKLNSIFGNKF